MSPIVYLLSTVVLVVCCQFLIKRGVSGSLARRGRNKNVLQRFVSRVFERHIVAALCLYAVATVLWLIALSMVDLSYAYPFVSLSILFTVGGAVVWFRESVSTARKVGIGLICGGLFLIALT